MAKSSDKALSQLVTPCHTLSQLGIKNEKRRTTNEKTTNRYRHRVQRK